MTKQFFKLVPSFKSGIGQINKRGNIVEMQAVQFTLNKKLVDSKFSKLNNHEGDIRLMLFTTQQKSKSLTDDVKDVNMLIAKENVCGNNQNSQHISPVSIDPERGTFKIKNSLRAEKYTKKYADRLTEHLNDNWGKSVVKIKNIRKNHDD